MVENAIRYGVNPFPSGGKVSVRVWRELDRLMVQIEDSGPGAEHWHLVNSTGYGIRGVRAQLETHFGDEWELTSEHTVEGNFRVRMSMPADDD